METDSWGLAGMARLCMLQGRKDATMQTCQNNPKGTRGIVRHNGRKGQEEREVELQNLRNANADRTQLFATTLAHKSWTKILSSSWKDCYFENGEPEDVLESANRVWKTIPKMDMFCRRFRVWYCKFWDNLEFE